MASRMKIFDHFAKPLAEVKVDTTTRNWVLNGYGRAEFSYGYSPKAAQSSQTVREDWLQFGNLVHIIHSPTTNPSGTKNGSLPTWTGIILPPRNWDDGVCHLTAYSAEAILMFRAMKYKDVSGTPQAVLKQIIENANSRSENIKFLLGVQDDLQLTFPDRLTTNAYDHILKLVKSSGMDWDVTGQVNANETLDLYVNLYARKGVEIETILQGGDGGNVELVSPLFTEQGTPYNQIFGYSQAQTENSRVGPIEAKNQEAYDDYGALQLNQVLVGKKDKSGVENSIKTLAGQRGRPVRLIKRNALDLGNLFSLLETGNTLKIKDRTVGFAQDGFYGFEANARILSMDYNDLSNKVPLNVEVF